MTPSSMPDLMPVLSRGKHRNARKGACFMEMASYLAGEKWSDHPQCTHPLLATLARDVNDHVSDAVRPRLVPLIPAVIGLRGGDPHVDAWIAREVGLTALSVASAERQGVAAVGLLRSERVLAVLDGLPADHVSERVRRALDDVPEARDWARGFTEIGWGQPGSFSRRSAPAIVHTGVAGIASAAGVDNESLLVDLLARVIGLAQIWLGHETRPVGELRWRTAAEMTARKVG
ncbi:MAG: hypothetical protein ACXVXC_14075 [Nocardioidaceae bacterium]